MNLTSGVRAFLTMRSTSWKILAAILQSMRKRNGMPSSSLSACVAI